MAGIWSPAINITYRKMLAVTVYLSTEVGIVPLPHWISKCTPSLLFPFYGFKKRLEISLAK